MRLPSTRTLKKLPDDVMLIFFTRLWFHKECDDLHEAWEVGIKMVDGGLRHGIFGPVPSRVTKVELLENNDKRLSYLVYGRLVR